MLFVAYLEVILFWGLATGTSLANASLACLPTRLSVGTVSAEKSFRLKYLPKVMLRYWSCVKIYKFFNFAL
jgi:hypothetical protein